MTSTARRSALSLEKALLIWRQQHQASDDPAPVDEADHDPLTLDAEREVGCG